MAAAAVTDNSNKYLHSAQYLPGTALCALQIFISFSKSLQSMGYHYPLFTNEESKVPSGQKNVFP